MKPGYLTTEFMLSVASMACATVALITHSIDSTTWSAIIGAGSVGYSISRGIAKSGGTVSNTPVAGDSAPINPPLNL